MTQASLVAPARRVGPGTARTDHRFGDLPYLGRWRQLLGPLHRSFSVVNRWFVVPAFQAGLGPLFSTPVAGSLMIEALRSIRRRSAFADAKRPLPDEERGPGDRLGETVTPERASSPPRTP